VYCQAFSLAVVDLFFKNPAGKPYPFTVNPEDSLCLHSVFWKV